MESQVPAGMSRSSGQRPSATIPTRTTVRGSFAGGIFGATLWMIILAGISGDWALAAGVGIAAAAIYYAATRAVLAGTHSMRTAALTVVVILVLLTLLVVNWRWEPWLAHYRQSPAYSVSGEMSLSHANLMILAIYGVIGFILALTSRRER